MKMKQILALGLAVVMTMSCLAACGKKEEGQPSESSASKSSTSQASQSVSSEASSASEEESKEITFPLAETEKYTVAALSVHADYPLETNPVLTKYLGEANIEFEYVLQALPGECKEKGNLLIAGKDYPEVFWKMADLDANKLGEDGIFIPLEDYIREYMPNLCAALDLDTVQGWDSITAPDGHIYSLPSIDEMPMIHGYSDNAFYINEPWLDRVGMEMPSNLDELYEVLKAFKTQDANGNGDPDDEIPFVARNERKWMLMMWVYGWMDYGNNSHVIIKDDTLEYVPYTEEFKEYLAWFAKCYQEGLLPAEFFTLTTEQHSALGKAGDCYGLYASSTAASNTLPEYAPNYVVLPTFTDNPLPLQNGIALGGLSLTDKCHSPEIILSWVDQFYTEEGGMDSICGLDGHGRKDNEDGTYISYANNFTNMAQFRMYGMRTTPALIPKRYYTGMIDPAREKTYAGKYGEDGIITNGVIIPSLVYTDEENERRNPLRTDLNNECENYFALVCTGEKDLEATWDEFQSTLKAIGSDEYLSIMQAAYKRAVENSK